MKIYDISQEVFGCRVFPGDPFPVKETLMSMDNGSLYNLTAFSMCAHNGTHIDAPFHFIKKGKTVDKVEIEKFMGFCYVTKHNGILTDRDAENILLKAGQRAKSRILIKGSATVSIDAARVFAKNQIHLLGNESQTVGPENAPMEVHKELLGNDVALLEGICLNDVDEGEYFLSAAPLCLAGADGAPCRAVLIKV